MPLFYRIWPSQLTSWAQSEIKINLFHLRVLAILAAGSIKEDQDSVMECIELQICAYYHYTFSLTKNILQ